SAALGGARGRSRDGPHLPVPASLPRRRKGGSMSLMKIPALLLLAAAFSLSPNRPTEPTVIEMTDNMVFIPKEATVVVGEVVEWKNVSTMSHTVNLIRDNCRTEDGKKWIQFPTGATPFTSGEIKPGEKYHGRFEIPGTYQYLC